LAKEIGAKAARKMLMKLTTIVDCERKNPPPLYANGFETWGKIEEKEASKNLCFFPNMLKASVSEKKISFTEFIGKVLFFNSLKYCCNAYGRNIVRNVSRGRPLMTSRNF